MIEHNRIEDNRIKNKHPRNSRTHTNHPGGG
jgi:hypothetical protein